jgi:Neuraminidase (sialidase)
MAITPYGDVYIAWEDARDGKNDIYVGISRDHGQSFKTETRVDTGEAKGKNHSFAPRLDADDDTLYVVWHDTRGGEKRDIFMNFSTDYGDTWLNTAERVETDNVGAFDSLYPDVAVIGETAHIVWSDAHSGGYDAYYRQAVQGGLVGDEAIRLDTDPAGYANSMNASVAVGDEAVIVAWQDGRADAAQEGYNDLYYNFSRDNGTVWNAPDLRVDSMEAGSAYKVNLNVELHRSEMMMAWTDGRNGTGDVFFHHMKVGEEATYQAVTE